MKKQNPARMIPGTVSSNIAFKPSAPEQSRMFSFLAFAALLSVLFWPPALEASPGPAWQETSISILGSKRMAEVAVPEGAKRVSVEVLNSKGEWIRWTTRKVIAGRSKISMRMPPRAALRTWRAWAEMPENLKFPAAFYKKKKSSREAASSGYGETEVTTVPQAGNITAGLSASTDSVSSNKDSSAEAKTEEADIWRTDGDTAFFFNQLRGLQVIDLSNPLEPSLECSLRLPAVGQDLYLLPESGGVRHVLLLARDSMEWDATVVHLVRISNGTAVVAASKKFPGMLVDSRLKGNRLFLATQTWRSWSTLNQDQAVLREVLIDPAASSIAEGTSFDVTGAWPLIAAGNDWIAVATSDWRTWNVSDVALFSISETGIFRRNPEPIRTLGRIYDKFKMQVSNGVFSAFSQGWLNSETGELQFWGTRITMLENFSTSGEKLAALEIVRNEWLFATRFAGDTAYAVTFEMVDPLWVIDLRNPSAPAITGHLEIPGWSTYIEPVGDMLFSIGWDEGRVAASLFDVADPANPTFASRVFLSDSWGAFSESLYDEKALRILPEENLVLIPFSVYRSESEDTGHRVQLLEIDRAAKVLRPRGRIGHDFEPRRSAMVGGALASISQRQLITADISNPDNPVVLADLLLAWPVQRAVTVGNFLYQISDGSSASPAVRISSASEPDTILSELQLEARGILDVEVRADRLFVLRGEGLHSQWPFWTYLRSMSVGNFPGGSDLNPVPTLALDIFDLANPEAPQLVGTTALEMDQEFSSCETSGLLFPGAGSAAVLVRQKPVYHWGSWWTPLEDEVGLPAFPDSGGSMEGKGSALAAVFDTVNIDARTLDFPKGKTIAPETAAAADGIVVVGAGDRLKRQARPSAPRAHHAEVLDLSNPAKPFFGKSLALPGRLLAVTELDRRGFLLWTEEVSEQHTARSLAVAASDFKDVYQIAKVPDIGHVTPAIEGRNVFVAKTTNVLGYRLTDSADFQALGTVPLDWEPNALRLVGEDLCAGIDQRFAAVPVATFPQGLRSWNAGLGMGFFWPHLRATELANLIRLPYGAYALPQGDYGVGIFK